MRAMQLVLAGALLTSLACAKPGPSATAAAPVSSSPAVAGARPCELTVGPCTQGGEPCGDPEQCYVILARVIPEGIPLQLNLEGLASYRWRYAADGRLLETPWHTFRHTGASSGLRRRRGAAEETEVLFDAQGRLTQIGSNLRLEYTPDGRTAGYSQLTDRGTWAERVTYEWGPRETFSVDWTYPDSAEYCDPGPSEVALDQHGRVVRELFNSCGINYSEFALSYRYDALGRFETIDVECEADDLAPETYRLVLSHECE
jgi:hypothetical protein